MDLVIRRNGKEVQLREQRSLDDRQYPSLVLQESRELRNDPRNPSVITKRKTVLIEMVFENP